jgi:hypothetical protein
MSTSLTYAACVVDEIYCIHEETFNNKSTTETKINEREMEIHGNCIYEDLVNRETGQMLGTYYLRLLSATNLAKKHTTVAIVCVADVAIATTVIAGVLDGTPLYLQIINSQGKLVYLVL